MPADSLARALRAEDTPPAVRSSAAAGLADHRWSRETDRTSATAPARAAMDAKWEAEVDPDGVLPKRERVKRANQARRAHMRNMAIEREAKKRAAKAAQS